MISTKDRDLFLMLIISSLLLNGCNTEENNPANYNDLKNLPSDTGGNHKSAVLGSTNAPYGYYVYTPSTYAMEGPIYPLMIFLHGSGEKGNSSTDPNKLLLVLRNGPPMMINKNTWNPSTPMIVVSPQCHDGGWNAQKIHEFIGYCIKTYKVNPSRIYITGLSMGASGTFDYIGTYGNDSYAAACVPICGMPNTSKATGFLDIPAWAFHGGADATVSPEYSINIVSAINNLNPTKKAKLTIYPGVGHNSWSMTYDGTGMGKESNEYDPYDKDIYSWMFQYQREESEILALVK
jgi:predicted peptidase